VKGIDVGGAGGTSFAAVEYYRASKEDNAQRFLGEAFWDWGIPTIVSLVEVTKSVKLPVIASGGLRSSVDIAKALSLNACLASLSQPILSVAVKSAKDTEKSLSCLIEGLRNVMFLVGAQKTSDLTEVPVVITGKTAEWLKTRNFQVEDYATRGQRGTGNS
jgi:isopentenyl-diphosphate delta-isomerase